LSWFSLVSQWSPQFYEKTFVECSGGISQYQPNNSVSALNATSSFHTLMPAKLQLTYTITNMPMIAVLQLLSMVFLNGHNATKIHICNTKFF